jgi:hypothetical protein
LHNPNHEVKYMPLTPRLKYYAADLICRDPRIHWEVTSVGEVELSKEQIKSACILHNETHYWLEAENVWVQEPIDTDHVRLIVGANNIQDALVHVWAHGLHVARSRTKAAQAKVVKAVT